ncbi:MAG: 16S rRNA (cytidine(1402)-2'-O)-methyltransferase [Ignavibacteria bacterium]|jgi:16S rRNA (cytidine1402-2'-O)-methyltransferase
MSSKIYIVSTPIGNLKDITFRALEVIDEVDFILCEDTRITSRILQHYKLRKELISFNAFSESKKIPSILKRIAKGENCALLSDAGTPLISDPGVRLISQAIKEDIEIIPIPGATALIAALTFSGLPTDSFIFEGFIPQKKGRQKILKELALEKRTIVIYESTYRIKKLLEEIASYMPDRYLVVCRELTKKFEETWRGYAEEIISDLDKKTLKGEFVVVLAPIGWKAK